MSKSDNTVIQLSNAVACQNHAETKTWDIYSKRFEGTTFERNVILGAWKRGEVALTLTMDELREIQGIPPAERTGDTLQDLLKEKGLLPVEEKVIK